MVGQLLDMDFDKGRDFGLFRLALFAQFCSGKATIMKGTKLVFVHQTKFKFFQSNIKLLSRGNKGGH